MQQAIEAQSRVAFARVADDTGPPAGGADPASQSATPLSASVSTDAIRLDKVKRSFRTPKGSYVALEDVSFAVKQGQFLAVVGPSGCGKSTLLSLMSGLARPDKGVVALAECASAWP